MELKGKFIPGNIVKKDVTSRESWTVVEIKGKLWLSPNFNAVFTHGEPLEVYGELYKLKEEDFIVLANISGWPPK